MTSPSRSLMLSLAACACLALAAAQAHAQVSGQLESVHGCTADYERYLPTGGSGTEVLFAHGFKRNLDTMRGWATHWQAQGIATTIMTLCNSSWFNGQHLRNADDLIALASALDIERPVYAGYSAGGLAAYLAALQDNRTAAYLGLDAVDSGNLALESSAILDSPAFFAVAEPPLCNAKGNFDAIIARHKEAHVRRIVAATHCDFEWPYDSRCNLVCGRNSEEERDRAQAEIRERATKWLRYLP